MPWGAAAAAAGVIGGAVISADASGDAADTAAKAGKRSAAQIEAAAKTARQDVFDFFPSAQKDLLSGAGAAGGLVSSGVGEQQRLLSAGNVGAQQTLGAGFNQQQNALLGLPVNQQAFAAREIELSPTLQNPLAQNLQQDPAAQQAGGSFQPQNLFSDISQVKPEKSQQAFEGLRTNRDVLSAISDGEIDVFGVDLKWFNELAKSPGWNGGASLLEAMKLTPEELARSLETGGFNKRNKARWTALVSELRRLDAI